MAFPWPHLLKKNFGCTTQLVGGILVPWSGIEPALPDWKRGVLTTWLPGKSPTSPFSSHLSMYHLSRYSSWIRITRLMRSALTKAEHPWRAEQKGRNEEAKAKYLSGWMGVGGGGPSESTGCPHQLCILKDYSGPGLSLLVKGGHEHRSGCPWEETAEALMTRTTVMEEEYRCRYSPGKQW